MRARVFARWCDRREELVFPHSTDIVAESQDRHALGEDVFGGLLDEAFTLFDNEFIRPRFSQITF